MNIYGQEDYDREDSPPMSNLVSPEYGGTGRNFGMEDTTSPINEIGFKPYSFLSSLGGKATSLKDVSSTEKQQGKFDKNVTMSRQFNVGIMKEPTVFQNSNVDRSELKSAKITRPPTAGMQESSRILKSSNTTLSINKPGQRPATHKDILELPDISSTSRRPLTAM